MSVGSPIALSTATGFKIGSVYKPVYCLYPAACVACDAVHEYMKVIEGTKCKEKNRTAYDPTLSCSSHFTKERTFHS